MGAPPIACMLSGQDYAKRLAWIAELNRRSLTRTDRADLQLTLSYDRHALKQVEELVEREQACCPFLSFVVQADAYGVKLTVTAPEEARDVADDVFQPFVGMTQSTTRGADCTCCGNPT